MSAAPNEPENYSIDEMMDRLKNFTSENPDQDGEMVVRADGTQAIRVRTRKRRSEQPKKDLQKRSRRTQILQVSAAMSLVVLAGLGIGSAIIFANSPPFRDDLLKKINQSTGAKAELTTFRMNPTTANAGGLTLRWPEGNVLDNLSLRGVVAAISPQSFLGKTMTGEEVTIAEGTLVLQIPKPGERLRSASALKGDLPITFNRYRIPKFQITLGTEAPPLKLINSQASLYKNPLNERTQFTLNGGDLTLLGWPKLKVDRAFLEFRGKEIDVVSLRVLDESDDRGVFEFAGTIHPYNPERVSNLAVELEAFPLSGLAGPTLGRLFSGKVDSIPENTSSQFSFRPSANPAAKLSVEFRRSLASNIELTGFPFLFSLTQLFADDWFKNPVFDDATSGALFEQDTTMVTLKNIDLKSKSRMALRGWISVATNKTLSGELEVGIAEGVITSSQQGTRLTGMFGPPQDGFRWVTLDISGPAGTPVDNFNELFTAAATRRAEEAREAESKGSTFEDLTKPR